LSLVFNRIQFTSDTLPSDIIGVSLWRPEKGEFEFLPGPVFTNVLLADEINRATPKTQSALLEAMNERTVTVEKTRFRLHEPFLVVATQNPVEYLHVPVARVVADCFLLRLAIGHRRPTSAEHSSGGGGVEAIHGAWPRDARAQAACAKYCGRPAALLPARAGDPTRRHPALAADAGAGAAPGFQRWPGRGRLRDPDDTARLAEPVMAHRTVLAGGGGEVSQRGRARVIREVPEAAGSAASPRSPLPGLALRRPRSVVRGTVP
jgi:MoxR-like ATPase